MGFRALITGGHGFVGQHLATYLMGQGWDVVRCDVTGGADILLCDITRREQIHSVLHKYASYTHVFHLAGITFVPQSIENPVGCFETNTIGTLHLIEELLTLPDPKPRLIFISSAEVYGPVRYLPVDEGHPLNPQNPYAISKLSSEYFCLYAHKNYGLDTVIVRPFNHSGAGQNDRFVLSNFVKQIIEMEKGIRSRILRVGNLDVARDFLHVLDVVSAYELIARGGKSGEVYNVSSGTACTLREIVDILKELSSIKFTIESDPTRVRKEEIPRIVGDSKKLRTQLGWSPRLSIHQILSDLLVYWRKKL